VARSIQRSLPLILAREFAANVATPFLVMDRDGVLVYFNERAEQIIGGTAAELGEMAERDWRQRFHVTRPDGTPVESSETPTAIARRECRPVQEVLVYTRLDGSQRTLSVTASPILGHLDELEGVFCVMWEVDEC
jgi:PAS domain S-box-containing protein